MDIKEQAQEILDNWNPQGWDQQFHEGNITDDLIREFERIAVNATRLAVYFERRKDFADTHNNAVRRCNTVARMLNCKGFGYLASTDLRI